MTLNKFCPVAQGEYYNNKSVPKSQLFFLFFSIFFLLHVHLQHNGVHPHFQRKIYPISVLSYSYLSQLKLYLHRDTFIDSRRLKGSGVLSDRVIHFPITVSFYYKTLLTSPTTR